MLHDFWLLAEPPAESAAMQISQFSDLSEQSASFPGSDISVLIFFWVRSRALQPAPRALQELISLLCFSTLLLDSAQGKSQAAYSPRHQ